MTDPGMARRWLTVETWAASDLLDAGDTERFGGKASALAKTRAAGLPVPPGVALDVAVVNAVAHGDLETIAELRRLFHLLDAPVAVRSSAVGEDSASASFAGQHLTVLGVRNDDALVDAVVQVWRSGRSESALEYRRRMGLLDSPKVAVVVQRMLDPTVAGVLFTRNPMSGADERMVEAAWGLGEAVVAGVVTPDNYRFARGGRVLAAVPGHKDVAIRPTPEGGTREEAVPPKQVESRCLDDEHLAALDALATRCEEVFGGPQDLEFAFENRDLFLLQTRPITAL